MPKTETESTQRLEQAARRKSMLRRILKRIVIIVVIVGLVLATRSAVQQWRFEASRLNEEVTQVELKIASQPDSDERVALIQKRDQMRRSLPTLGNLYWTRIAMAAALYALGLLPNAMVLGGWLSVFGHRPNRLLIIAAQTLGHIGKYVPGKAMVVVMRVGALSKASVPAVPATISVFLETFMMMAVGAAVAGVIICTLPVPPWMLAAAVIGAIVASLPTLPPLLQPITNRLIGRDTRLGSRAWAACASGWGWSILSWLCIGSSFAMLVSAIPSAAAPPDWKTAFLSVWPMSTAAISLAMVIGFVSLIPGGAGVREFVLATILGLAIGATQALLAAILARLVFIVVECLMALIASRYIQRFSFYHAPSS
ncbi:hypothetical protein Q31b_41910 [Novipirellula aureliae]|uniref:Uncharacterized protein n=1 Tax=Novipirellula aureliae TaxID=2527966 RepID=A0A5C6DQS8_9BACT|nr:lysylphosphatidylglycerol synthase domain-containing protein [Novipirellula aureliae]TWU39108.1 hypothetical protein Q31b_41910 [Novipirellula aureliae]